MRRFSFVLVGFASGAVILTVQTRTLTGNCTGSQFLPDVTTTATFTGTCTGTAVVTSTSTIQSTTNTTSGQNFEMVAHAFGPSCSPLGVAESILRVDSTPQTVTGDSWAIVFVISNPAQNITAFGSISTINGAHNFTISEFVNGIEQPSSSPSNQLSIAIPNEAAIHNGSDGLPSMVNTQAKFANDFGLQEFIDFYSDGDGIQAFWYGPHTAFQAFSYNLNLPVPFAPVDVAAFFAPIPGQTSVLFSPLTLPYFFVGQQKGGALSYAMNASPCATTQSLQATNNIVTNACEVLTTTGLKMEAV